MSNKPKTQVKLRDTVLQVPKNVKRRQYDYVSYDIWNSSKRQYEPQWESTCYFALMRRLGRVQIRCKPYKSPASNAFYERIASLSLCNGKSVLPKDIFLSWMQLCKEYGLVPKTAECYCTSGCNIMEMVYPKKYDRHLLYAALCCYRWSECKAPLIYKIVTYHQRHPTINFWQVFHYFLAKENIGSGHSFIAVTGRLGRADNNNLARSLAAHNFFQRKGISVRKKIRGSTLDALDRETVSLGVLKVKSAEDILQERWAELYQLPRLTKTSLTKRFGEICR